MAVFENVITFNWNTGEFEISRSEFRAVVDVILAELFANPGEYIMRPWLGKGLPTSLIFEKYDLEVAIQKVSQAISEIIIENRLPVKTVIVSAEPLEQTQDTYRINIALELINGESGNATEDTGSQNGIMI